MQKLSILALLFLLAKVSLCGDDNASSKWGLGIDGGLAVFDESLESPGHNHTSRASARVQYLLSKRFQLEAQLFTSESLTGSESESIRGGTFNVAVAPDFRRRLAAYALIGVGAVWVRQSDGRFSIETRTGFCYQAGVGGWVQLPRESDWRIRTEISLLREDVSSEFLRGSPASNHLSYTLGVDYRF